MALFVSTFTNKVDKKGRVSVPAPFRASLGDQLPLGIVVFRSHQYECLEGFDWARMEDISERLEHYDLFSEDQDDLATTVFAESVHLQCDGEGRVMLPAELMSAAKISEHATFVGLGKKFQIWNPKTFEMRKSEARSKVLEKRLTIPSSKNGGAS